MDAVLRRFVSGIALALAAAAGLAVLDAAAAPQSESATRAELVQWLERLRDGGTNIATPVAWRYLFSAPASANLEPLSRELVSNGYAIERLRRGAADRMELSMTRVELASPAGLERRNRELAALARKHGVRYDGVDAPASGPR
jgi:hypothetical protein